MTQENPQEAHIKWLRERLIATEADIRDTEKVLEEVESKLRKLRESAEYFRGVISVVTGQEAEPQKQSSSTTPRSGIRMPKDAIRPEFAGMLVKEAAQLVIDSRDEPLHLEALIDAVYENPSEEERKLIRRSFSSELRRGAEKGLWDKAGRNIFASKKLSLFHLANIDLQGNEDE